MTVKQPKVGVVYQLLFYMILLSLLFTIAVCTEHVLVKWLIIGLLTVMFRYIFKLSKTIDI